MKKISILIITVLFIMNSSLTYSQTINWNNLKQTDKNILNVNAGAEYGLTFGAGYGYHLKSKFPIILNAEYSFPSGRNLTDDFKTKVGGSIDLYHLNDFHFIARVQGVFRRYQNPYANLLNFGSDMSGIVGYYRSKWFVAGEFGFDKAIVTHFKHTEEYKKNFPGVKDGWYEPSTGGNFYYGIQTGYSFRKNDLYLKFGKIVEQDFSSDPLLPFYFQVGYNFRFK